MASHAFVFTGVKPPVALAIDDQGDFHRVLVEKGGFDVAFTVQSEKDARAFAAFFELWTGCGVVPIKIEQAA